MSHAGRLLVATPLIGDPNFERTVLYLLSHTRDGAFGVVLNRPSDTRVAEAVDAWAPHVASPAVLFVGGPVDPHTVIGIGRRRPAADGASPIDPAFDPCGDTAIGRLGTVDLNADPERESARWFGLRLFAGSAGWASGQLEDEIAEGAWWVVDAAPDDVDTSSPSTLWGSVVRRQHGEVAWFANCPLDPSAN